MSFKNHTIKELTQVAEHFAVDLDGIKGKENIINELEELGVSYEMADKQVFNPEKDEDDQDDVVVQAAPTALVNPVVVRMTRKNPRYDVEANGRIYTFTQENPYVLLEESDADIIFDREEGFRMASPREVKEYYG
jgi:hypothetical protein